MITRFRVQNFKNLVDIDFKPQPLNVIIGSNGCGKSSLLQAIDFLRAFFMSSVELYLQEKGWEFKDLPNLRQTSKTIQWDVTAELDADGHGWGRGTYEYSIRLSPRRYLGIGSEKLIYTAPGTGAQTLLSRQGRNVEILNRKTGEYEHESYRVLASIISTIDPSHDRAKYPELLCFREWVERFRYYLIWDPKILRLPDRGKHEELGPSGEHLAPLLALLKQRNSPKFNRLLQRIRRLFPYVSDISITGGRTWGWRTIRLHERDGQKDVTFNSQQMSDGVLRLLAVTSLLYLDHPPSLIMFEEPEDGVHPQLIREEVQILRELTLRKPPNRCQVIFTTHSPYVLDEFYDHPEEVFIMERPQPQMGASLSQLSTASQLAKVKDTFSHSLGEAWFSGLIGGTAGAKP
jgi:predicted ATPase